MITSQMFTVKGGSPWYSVRTKTVRKNLTLTTTTPWMVSIIMMTVNLNTIFS